MTIDAVRTEAATPATASADYMGFVGVTTASSSIMKVFPAWAEFLGLGDVGMKGVDGPLHASREASRDVVRGWWQSLTGAAVVSRWRGSPGIPTLTVSPSIRGYVIDVYTSLAYVAHAFHRDAHLHQTDHSPDG